MYITGEEINNIADIGIYDKKYIDKFSVIKKYCKKIIYLDEINIEEKIKDCKIFFIKMSYIQFFINNILPYIKNKFILITHNGDEPSGNYKNIINNPLLIKWYGENMTVISEKTECLPIGLENLMWKRTNFKIIDKFKNNNKKNLLYINFSIRTNKNREIILKKILEKGFKKNNNKPWNEYMEELSSYKFALSPKGNGIDCHRTWECLYLGVIPIVEKSIVMNNFIELPILIVDNYDIITKQFLEEKYIEFQNKKYNYDKLNINYWKKNIYNLFN